MRSISSLIMIALMVFSLNTFGQIGGVCPEEKPYIEVNGIAEIEVVPDEIYISIILAERYENKVKVTIEEQEEKMKSAIKSLGIDLKNLFLSDVNADYLKVSWQKKDVLTKKDYVLKVTDANSVGKVFMELDKLAIKDASVSKVNHSKIDSLKREVRIMAIKAAREKADYLLEAIGEQTGKAQIVRENEFTPYNATSNTIRGARAGGEILYIDGVKVKEDEDNSIVFEKIKVKSDVYVKFLIKE